MANTFSIAQSAITAAQTGISTTGQNIANAGTKGYSRQTVVQGTATPVALGFGYLGQGTQVEDIKRAYDEFLGVQQLSAQTTSSQFQTQFDQMQALDNMLADPSVGLSPAMQNFFNGIQDLSAAPSDEARRQAFFANAEALVNNFHVINDQLESINQGINQQLSVGVENINDLAKQLGSLNQSIASALSSGTQQPNDLLDKRDQALLELSKLVKVNVFKQANNYDIYIGNGQPLVVGSSVNSFKLLTDPSETMNPNEFDVAYNLDGNTSKLTANNLAGGQIGGLLEFRSQVLDSVRSQVDALASGIGLQINTVNHAGLKPDGNFGGDLFTIDSTALHSAASISLTTSDIAALAAGTGVSGTPPAAGDNSNLLKMVNLQTQSVMNNNTASFQQAYSKIVSQVGSKTREMQLTSDAAKSVLQQSNSAIESISGVNLDDEAANLIRYQQIYQAAGKLIQITKDMFDSLLQMQ